MGVVEWTGRTDLAKPLVLQSDCAEQPQAKHSRRLKEESRMNSKSVICGFLLLAMVAEEVVGLMGSCREAKKCCEGKDPECGVTKADLNSIIMDPDDAPCYCDHNCLNMGDCCPDFKDYCGVIDCQVSSWSSWGSCSSECGSGKATRTRTVIRPQSNGGVSCPDLLQHRTCKGRSELCNRRELKHNPRRKNLRHFKSAFRETGMLLPGKYSEVRMKQKEKYDVRANLKTFVPEEENNDRYCIVFKVAKAMKACRRSKETSALLRGEEVCVSCESKASRPHLGNRCSGHGVDNKLTRFKNVISPGCHGRWTRVDAWESCPCKEGPHFIFV